MSKKTTTCVHQELKYCLNIVKWMHEDFQDISHIIGKTCSLSKTEEILGDSLRSINKTFQDAHKSIQEIKEDIEKIMGGTNSIIYDDVISELYNIIDNIIYCGRDLRRGLFYTHCKIFKDSRLIKYLESLSKEYLTLSSICFKIPITTNVIKKNKINKLRDISDGLQEIISRSPTYEQSRLDKLNSSTKSKKIQSVSDKFPPRLYNSEKQNSSFVHSPSVHTRKYKLPSELPSVYIPNERYMIATPRQGTESPPWYEPASLRHEDDINKLFAEANNTIQTNTDQK